MAVVYDRVQENSITLGTGTYTLAGAVAGYRTFAAACSTGDVVPYVAVDTATNDWEIGLGTYSAGTLSRTTIRRSSNANAAVSWVSGTRQVFIDATAADGIASLITSGIGAGTAGQRLASGGSAANPSWVDTDSSATFTPGTTSITPPVWAKMVQIEVWGGGGGGGGGSKNDVPATVQGQAGGAGAGGGGYQSGVFRVADLVAALGASWPCAIGSGGGGGAGSTVDLAAATVGGDGGNTFFGASVAAGAWLAAYGGKGGTQGTIGGAGIGGIGVAANGANNNALAVVIAAFIAGSVGASTSSSATPSNAAAVSTRGSGGGGGAGAGFTALGTAFGGSAGGQPLGQTTGGQYSAGANGGAGLTNAGLAAGGGGGGAGLLATTGTAFTGGAGAVPAGGGGGGGSGRTGANGGTGGAGGNGQIKVSYW